MLIGLEKIIPGKDGKKIAKSASSKKQ